MRLPSQDTEHFGHVPKIPIWSLYQHFSLSQLLPITDLFSAYIFFVCLFNAAIWNSYSGAFSNVHGLKPFVYATKLLLNKCFFFNKWRQEKPPFREGIGQEQHFILNWALGFSPYSCLGLCFPSLSKLGILGLLFPLWAEKLVSLFLRWQGTGLPGFLIKEKCFICTCYQPKTAGQGIDLVTYS